MLTSSTPSDQETSRMMFYDKDLSPIIAAGFPLLQAALRKAAATKVLLTDIQDSQGGATLGGGNNEQSPPVVDASVTKRRVEELLHHQQVVESVLSEVGKLFSRSPFALSAGGVVGSRKKFHLHLPTNFIVTNKQRRQVDRLPPHRRAEQEKLPAPEFVVVLVTEEDLTAGGGSVSSGNSGSHKELDAVGDTAGIKAEQFGRVLKGAHRFIVSKEGVVYPEEVALTVLPNLVEQSLLLGTETAQRMHQEEERRKEKESAIRLRGLNHQSNNIDQKEQKAAVTPSMVLPSHDRFISYALDRSRAIPQ